MAVTIERVSEYGVGIFPVIKRLLQASDVWKYLKTLDRPTVVIKPNWVQERTSSGADEWVALITHPTVVAAATKAVTELLTGNVRIVVCDGPHTYASFEQITARGDLLSLFADIRKAWPNLQLEVLDLRRETWIVTDGVVVARRPNRPDPAGYTALNLGDGSLFSSYSGEGRYYGADYDRTEVNRHHWGTTHEYLIAGTPLRADLFINLPKLKTHKKTGITCAAKNLVGVNGDKNWLPHHTEGTPGSGGDERPETRFIDRTELAVKRLAQSLALASPRVGGRAYRYVRRVSTPLVGTSDTTIRNGNWSGNDTCWRMALDLNRAILYGNPDGTFRDSRRPKPYLTLVDGVVGGEGNGPLDPKPVSAGVLIYSDNPAEADATAATLMGFDIEQLPIVSHAFRPHRWPIARSALAEIDVFDSAIAKCVRLNELEPVVIGGFEPHFAWASLRRTLTGQQRRARLRV